MGRIKYHIPKIWKACSNDEMRPAMAYALIEDGFITATNGHIMIKTDLRAWKLGDDEDIIKKLNGKLIHRSTLQLIARKKWDVMQFTKDRIIVGDLGKPRQEFKYDSMIIKDRTFKDIHGNEEKYPDYKEIYESLKTMERKGTDYFGFNPKLLANLDDCFVNHFNLKFEVYTRIAHIKVIPQQSDADGMEIGIIMPVRVDDIINPIDR